MNEISPFPIVAIGASAGGLKAIKELVKNLPSDTGMAFIYVQHLSPDRPSALTTLLSRLTEMNVQEITNGIAIKPDNFYIIPPNKEMNITDGHFELKPRRKGISFSIDIFFSSLAEHHKERVIGVILSGSVNDGTQGMKDIRKAGGITFAQDDSAEFNSMPESAIAAGVVDHILSPKEIAAELSKFGKSSHPRKESSRENLIDNDDPDLHTILRYLHSATDVDFGSYKMNTIKRRIVRRMHYYKFHTPKEYVKLLEEKKDEIEILYKDLLINVTSFFRETETYNYLKSTLLPALLESKVSGNTLRIWIPACSTGEEAYSMAMMLQEIQKEKEHIIPVQIFATDLSGYAISKARTGIYSEQEVESVSQKRLKNFFIKTENAYRINKSVREMCVFATHNILLDPPFSRLDFISCCNLFIYLGATAQKKVVSTFYYALKDDGYLMLGKSETIGNATELFSDVHKKHKIFIRKAGSISRKLPALSPRVLNTPLREENDAMLSKKRSPVAARTLDNSINALLVSDFMPSSVVIGYEMEIVQFRGSTDLYLTHSSGRASLNILKMARPEIAFELRNAISEAIKAKSRISKRGLEMKMKDTLYLISFEVVPLKVEWDEPLLLILFSGHEYHIPFQDIEADGKKNSQNQARRIKKLEEELAAARADTLNFIQEQEAFNEALQSTNEELQSSNEELVSSNEELQTVNEELATSKEEIESANEELMSTNHELQNRYELLNESYEYTKTIIDTIHDSLLILDKDLTIKAANNSFYKTFNIKEEKPEGQSLYKFNNQQWDIPELREMLESVILKNLPCYNFEIMHNFPGLEEKVIILNAKRIVLKTHREQSILLAIADITEVRKKEKELQISERKEQELQFEKNRQLEKINKELEAFAFLSSHDLQEPLRKIRTFASLITEEEHEKLSDKGKDYFRRMTETSARMQTLINDLLTHSRAKSGEFVLERYDLNVIIEDVLKDYDMLIQEKNAAVEIGQLCHLSIIPFQFHQLVSNLIGNALKFSKPNIPPHIIITSIIEKGSKLNYKKLAPLTNYCYICIKDNGIGFEAQYKEKIFEVFQRLHSREKYHGTGIGLAIVKKIVENHHGFINVISEPDKGTQFDIYIPS